MTRSELPQIARDVFCKVITLCPAFHGRTYNIFDPVPNKKMDFNVFIADSGTGYCTCIPIERKNLVHINENDFGEVVKRVMDKLTFTIQTQPVKTSPVDYTQIPLRAGRKSSILDKTVNLKGNTRVHMYHWSSLIIPLKDQGYK